MPDRVTVDIEGYRRELEALAKEGERSLSQQIRLFIRQGVERNKAEKSNNE